MTALVADVRRLKMSQERYYTRHLADSREEYYSGKGEAPGRWVGPGLHALGLAEGARVTFDCGRSFQVTPKVYEDGPIVGGLRNQPFTDDGTTADLDA